MNVRLQALLFKILFVIASMCAQIIQHQIMIAFSASNNVIERGNAKSKAVDAAKPWQDEINKLGIAVQELLEAEAKVGSAPRELTDLSHRDVYQTPEGTCCGSCGGRVAEARS